MILLTFFDIFLLLFFIGFLSFLLFKDNLITIMISLEVMLLNINVLLVLSSLYLDDLFGQLLVLFVFATAASEAAVGLALFILYYRFLGLLSVDTITVLKG